METVVRKRKIYLFVLVASLIAAAVWINSQRTVTDLEPRQPSAENVVFEETPKPVQPAQQPELQPTPLPEEKPPEIFRNAAALYESSKRWMHVRELTGNNDHPMITIAMNFCGLDGDKGYAWCAAAQAEIHHFAGIKAPKSARVVDWFATPQVVWEKKMGNFPDIFDTNGMVGGIYFPNLGRLAHIVLIVGEDKNNYYTREGNTNLAGSREGDGFYAKTRSKTDIAALADYTISGDDFQTVYGKYLKK